MSGEFDHENDAYDQAIQLEAAGQPLDEEPSIGEHTVSCKYCGRDGLRWVDTLHGWKLCEPEKLEGMVMRHGCGRYQSTPIPSSSIRPKLPKWGERCRADFGVKDEVYIIFKTGPEWNVPQRAYHSKDDAHEECAKMEKRRKKSKNPLDQLSQYVVETMEVT